MFWPCQDSQVYKTAQTGDYYYGPQAIRSLCVLSAGAPNDYFLYNIGSEAKIV